MIALLYDFYERMSAECKCWYRFGIFFHLFFVACFQNTFAILQFPVACARSEPQYVIMQFQTKSMQHVSYYSAGYGFHGLGMLACQWISILLFADLRRDSDHMWSPTGHRKVLEGIFQEVGLSALPSKMPAAWPQQNFIFKSCCCCGVMCSIHYMCMRLNCLLYFLLLHD